MEFTICLSTYNRAGLLGGAIESALRQTLPATEILIVDDGSEDETEKVVSQFTSPSIRYIKKEHSGVSETRNRGVREAKGDYIVALADDDELPEHCLKSHMENFLRTPGLMFSYGDHILIDEEGKQTGIQRFEDWTPERLIGQLALENPLPDAGCCLKKEAYQKIGYYDVTLPRAVDYDLWARFAIKGLKAAHMGNTCSRYRVHDNSLTGASPRRTTDRAIRQKVIDSTKTEELFPEFDFERLRTISKKRPLWLWGASDLGLAHLSIFQKAGLEISGFVDSDPKKHGQTLAEKPIRSPDCTLTEPKPFLVISSCAQTPIAAALKKRSYREHDDWAILRKLTYAT
ncbi:glycosyltransferase [Pelagicoccus mobilis]|uniref:Glycosyltransferase n=1 Tax=Pelagicoccus mobilis TaxID=415221 RepID=A0A934VS74_9BACT|nr:glycosyltransferase [Pelagicoccus mobilis]MBK1878224.1 glycosyltransferase [Pelagicoccus mobilis]